MDLFGLTRIKNNSWGSKGMNKRMKLVSFLFWEVCLHQCQLPDCCKSNYVHLLVHALVCLSFFNVLSILFTSNMKIWSSPPSKPGSHLKLRRILIKTSGGKTIKSFCNETVLFWLTGPVWKVEHFYRNRTMELTVQLILPWMSFPIICQYLVKEFLYLVIFYFLYMSKSMFTIWFPLQVYKSLK